MKKNKLRVKYDVAAEALTWKGQIKDFPEKVEKILLIQTAFLGDLILTTPLFSLIKQIFPKASLDVVVIPQTEAILGNNPDIDNILIFDKKGISSSNSQKSKRKNLSILATNLKQKSYDLGISPHRSFTTSRLMKKAKIKFCIGYEQAAFSRFFYRIRVKRRKGVHEIQRHLDLMTPLISFFKNKKKLNNHLNTQQFPFQTRIFPGRTNYEKAVKLLKLTAPEQTPKKPVVALAPGSVWPTKKWPVEYFMELIELLEDSGALTILIGGPEDEELCKMITNSGNNSTIVAAGIAAVLDSAAIIEKSDLLFCNDSAPLHIANAMNTPVISFFGTTSPVFGFGPFQKKDIILEAKNLLCQPCKMHGGPKCPLSHFNCMKEIKPLSALRAAKSILKWKT